MNVEFDEPEIVRIANRAPRVQNSSSITKMLIANKIVKNEADANTFLLVAAVVLIIATVVLLWVGLAPRSANIEMPPEDGVGIVGP